MLLYFNVALCDIALFDIELFNAFSTNVPLLYPLKTLENLRFSNVFSGNRNGALVENGFMLHFLILHCINFALCDIALLDVAFFDAALFRYCTT